MLSVRPFIMQTDNYSYRKIPPIKLHVHFIISILKKYYFKRRFGRIRNTIIKKMDSLLSIPDFQWCSRISLSGRAYETRHALGLSIEVYGINLWDRHYIQQFHLICETSVRNIKIKISFIILNKCSLTNT